MTNLALKNAETIIDTNNELLFNFLDHMVLLITQAKNAEEVDILMDDFMSDDVLKTLTDNKEFFSLLNVVWFSTFNRVFIEQRSESFPLKVLWLPILFKQLGWEIEDIETFELANYNFRNQTQQKNDLYKHLVELFLNGLKFDASAAYKLFKDKIDKLELKTKQEKKNISMMLKDIESIGWK